MSASSKLALKHRHIKMKKVSIQKPIKHTSMQLSIHQNLFLKMFSYLGKRDPIEIGGFILIVIASTFPSNLLENTCPLDIELLAVLVTIDNKSLI